MCLLSVADAKTELLKLPFSPFTRIINWRERRKDDRLSAVMEALAPQLTDAERSLRELMVQVMERKETVRRVADECFAQLTACVTFTNKGLAHSEPIVDGLRDLVDAITQETLQLKNMVVFNTDLVKQTRFELRVQAQTPAWARNAAGKGAFSARMARSKIGRAHIVAIRDEVDREDTSDDPDSHLLLSRLVQLRATREAAMRQLSVALESKETLLNNLENCINVKLKIEARAKKEGGSSPRLGTDVALSAEEREAAFLSDADALDRDWYAANCHIVFLNADKLVQRQDCYHEMVMSASSHLQRLVEIRENMNNLQLEGYQSGSQSPSSQPATPTPLLTNPNSGFSFADGGSTDGVGDSTPSLGNEGGDEGLSPAGKQLQGGGSRVGADTELDGGDDALGAGAEQAGAEGSGSQKGLRERLSGLSERLTEVAGSLSPNALWSKVSSGGGGGASNEGVPAAVAGMEADTAASM